MLIAIENSDNIVDYTYLKKIFGNTEKHSEYQSRNENK